MKCSQCLYMYCLIIRIKSDFYVFFKDSCNILLYSHCNFRTWKQNIKVSHKHILMNLTLFFIGSKFDSAFLLLMNSLTAKLFCSTTCHFLSKLVSWM